MSIGDIKNTFARRAILVASSIGLVPLYVIASAWAGLGEILGELSKSWKGK